jgi:MFS family permease
LRVNALAMCVNTFLAAPFIALVPAMAQQVLLNGNSDNAGSYTAVLITAQGVGAVAMGLALGPLAGRFGIRRVMLTMMTLLPFALAAYAVAPTLAASATALLIVGALYLGALSSFQSVSQLRAPPSIRGRVLAVNTMILGALYPLGAVVQGKLGDQIGLRATTFLSGAVLLVVIAATRVIRPGITKAIDTPVS